MRAVSRAATAIRRNVGTATERRNPQSQGTERRMASIAISGGSRASAVTECRSQECQRRGGGERRRCQRPTTGPTPCPAGPSRFASSLGATSNGAPAPNSKDHEKRRPLRVRLHESVLLQRLIGEQHGGRAHVQLARQLADRRQRPVQRVLPVDDADRDLAPDLLLQGLPGAAVDDDHVLIHRRNSRRRRAAPAAIARLPSSPAGASASLSSSGHTANAASAAKAARIPPGLLWERGGDAVRQDRRLKAAVRRIGASPAWPALAHGAFGAPPPVRCPARPRMARTRVRSARGRNTYSYRFLYQQWRAAVRRPRNRYTRRPGSRERSARRIATAEPDITVVSGGFARATPVHRPPSTGGSARTLVLLFEPRRRSSLIATYASEQR